MFDKQGRFLLFNKKTLRDIDLANVLTHQPEYPNLNVLQFAAVTGDIRLLEKIVAYGAAIDSPVKESRKRIISGASWHNSSLLVLCTACHGQNHAPSFKKRVFRGGLPRMRNAACPSWG